jgi:hypothetical protein
MRYGVSGFNCEPGVGSVYPVASDAGPPPTSAATHTPTDLNGFTIF